MPKISGVDAALAAVFSNISVTDMRTGSVSVPVPVFVEVPDIEEFPKRSFPAISITLVSMDFENDLEHSDSDTIVSYDPATNTFVSRRRSHWYRLIYQVHSWALYAQQDRDLLRKIDNRLEPRDTITVDSKPYWVFRDEREFSFIQLNEMVDDRTLYHKVWTFEVLVDIDNEETDTNTQAVTEIQMESYSVKNIAVEGSLKPVNSLGQVVADAALASRALHREIRFNDTDYWFNP